MPKAIFYLLKGDYNPNIYAIILQLLPFSFPLSLYDPYKAPYSIYLRGTITPVYTQLYYSCFHFLFHHPYMTLIKPHILSTRTLLVPLTGDIWSLIEGT